MKYILVLLFTFSLSAEMNVYDKIRMQQLRDKITVVQLEGQLQEAYYFIAVAEIENWDGKHIDGKDDDRGPLQITPDFYKDAVWQLKQEGKPYPSAKDLYYIKESKIIARAYYRRYKLKSPFNRARAHNNGPSYTGPSDYAIRVLNLMRSYNANR